MGCLTALGNVAMMWPGLEGPSGRAAAALTVPVSEVKTRTWDYHKLEEAGADAVHQELMKYVLEQAWAIPTPVGYCTAFWWPWIKNIDGNTSTLFMKYHWIDQALKQSMGH